jgi:thiol-disulfide isomerase/thioredoxin
MESATILRLALAGALVAAGVGSYRLINTLILRRARSKTNLPPEFRPGRPAILYFSSPDCGPCKTLQKPEITKVSATLTGQIQVIEIDTTVAPALAAAWGVFSLPTTFILDAVGQARHVNHGVVSAKKIQQQLSQKS